MAQLSEIHTDEKATACYNSFMVYKPPERNKTVICICGKEFRAIRWRVKYCDECRKSIASNSAKKEANNKYTEYIARWKEGLEDGMRGCTGISSHIRKYLFLRAKDKCEECGWSKINQTTGNIPLTINHIDGNHRNNKEENLELICPNCHSLTSNYCALNKGNGRPNRKVVLVAATGLENQTIP